MTFHYIDEHDTLKLAALVHHYRFTRKNDSLAKFEDFLLGVEKGYTWEDE